MCNWIEFPGYQKRCSFCWKNSTNHEVAHLFIVSKSILRLPAADCGLSAIIVQAGVISKKRIDEFILRTLVLYHLYKLKRVAVREQSLGEGGGGQGGGGGDTGKNRNPIRSSTTTLCLRPER